MKFYLFLFFILVMGKTFAQEEKEYITLVNGEKLDAQIKKIRPGYIVAKVGPVEREYTSEMIQSLYSKDYHTVFESHRVSRRKKPQLLGLYRNGEVMVFCQLKNVDGMSFGNRSFAIFANRRSQSIAWALEGKPFFRHRDEPSSVIHEANKKELLKVKLYECFPLMIKLVNGLTSMDLTLNIRNQSYRDLIVKYNGECEAKLREKEDEKGKR